jgi:methylmalonyl-CoA epimerase
MTLDIFKGIDHIAIAVTDLEEATKFYRDTLGMKVTERRVTEGAKSGMISVVLSSGAFSIVLLEGADQRSQVSQYIEEFGPGVQHVAFQVSEIEETSEILKKRGVDFATNIIIGNGLKQIFSRRDKASGMMIELIERTGEEGFQEDSVNSLFEQLESSGDF